MALVISSIRRAMSFFSLSSLAKLLRTWQVLQLTPSAWTMKFISS